ncbi:hypothetical protein CR513_45993, partial [Mucuna pruriens]
MLPWIFNHGPLVKSIWTMSSVVIGPMTMKIRSLSTTPSRNWASGVVPEAPASPSNRVRTVPVSWRRIGTVTGPDLTSGRTILIAKERWSSKSIKKIRLDNGTEYVNLEFSKFVTDQDIIHELTCVNTPQQNEVAKQKNHHLLEDVQDTNHESTQKYYNEVEGEDHKEAEEEDHNKIEKEDRLFGIKYQRQEKPTLVPQQIESSESEINVMCQETRKLRCKTTGVSIEQNHKIGSEESPPIKKSQYQRLMEKLIYLTHTRPNIVYAVSVVSQFMHDPRERHIQAVEKILHYLKTSLVRLDHSTRVK